VIASSAKAAARTVARSPGEHHGMRRWLVLALALAGVAMFVGSYFLPYWSFRLVAPQYPKGLVLMIGLSGVTGDVREIDIINHYIGMHAIADAAKLERSLGPYLVAAIGLSIVIGMLFAGRKINWLGVFPPLALPLGFLGTTFYWMYEFGHDLDPTAAIDFEPFMPTLLGEGVIGQFHTFAAPAIGFWVALGGTAFVLAALMVRKNVCDTCPIRNTCRGTIAPHYLMDSEAKA
jgi:copper chaperone NosL